MVQISATMEAAMVKLEVGKYYKTRDGRKVRPMAISRSGVIGVASGECWWMETGTKHKMRDSDHDIIAEWHDFPVRTVTRKEIVPGAYGKVRVTGGMYIHVNSMSTAAELRAAIKTLTQIAEALEESEQ
jgi:hypothetical protein